MRESTIQVAAEKPAALIETQYFPPIVFFVLWAHFGKIILEQHENYQKRSFRNRCYITGADGKFHLSIPLRKGKNVQQQITDVVIAHDEPWPDKHWRAVQSAYGKAPFFRFYAEEVHHLYNNPGDNLFEFNLSIVKVLGKLIGLTGHIFLSSKYTPDPGPPVIDFRNKIGIGHGWQNYFKIGRYNQVFEDRLSFSENLSILDLLFCTGPEAISILRSSKLLISY